jgi:RNA polymerase sigma-70 factor (ECF subfamily)
MHAPLSPRPELQRAPAESANQFWRQRRADLRRFVSRRVADRHEVDDIVQDVLVRAHESMHQLAAPDRLPAWLARIAANRIVDHYRARRPSEELPEDIAAAEAEDDPVQALAPCLPAMVDRLPATYRDALRLSELDGLTQREVAQRLGLSLSGAKSRVQRGREQLRRLVEGCCRIVLAGSRIVDFERRDAPAAGKSCTCLRPS